MLKKNKRANFFDLLSDQMEVTLQGLKALQKYTRSGDPADGEEVMRLEKQGDMRRRILIDEMNSTFITPFDREDLFDLSRCIDDVLDYALTTVEELTVFKIAPDKPINEMVDTLNKMGEYLYTAVTNMEKRKTIAAEEALKAKKLENTVNSQSFQALAELYEIEDYRTIFKYREVYRHLNRAADMGDGVADLIMNIIVQL